MRLMHPGEISLAAEDAPTSDHVPTAEVVINGTRTGTVVTGARLEAAVDCEGRHLLFVTDDVPYEEFLSIYLLDEAHHLIDSARIGGMYVSGHFSGPLLEAPDRITVRFPDDVTWCVRVLDWPRIRPTIGLPLEGLSRPPGLRRHMDITRCADASSRPTTSR